MPSPLEEIDDRGVECRVFLTTLIPCLLRSGHNVKIIYHRDDTITDAAITLSAGLPGQEETALMTGFSHQLFAMRSVLEDQLPLLGLTRHEKGQYIFWQN